MAHPYESSVELKIVEAWDLPRTIFRRPPCAFVEVVVAGNVNVSHRTQIIKSKKNIRPRWDTKFLLPTLPPDSDKVTFSVFHDGNLHNECLGRIEIGMRVLLERQHQSNEDDIILSLTDKRGNISHSRLAIRVDERSASIAADAVKRARAAEQALSPPEITVFTDATTSLANTITNQVNLTTSLGSLLDKVGILVKLGDEVAKIHPYVNFAWQVLSAGLKMVQGQQDRDQKISTLVRTMEETYSFVALIDEVKKNHVLQDVVEQMLKQTIECGFFIQEYARRNFAGRTIVQPFLGTDDKITAFCAEFDRLRKNFDSGMGVDTALVLSRTAPTIDAIRRDQVLSKLQAVDMDEYNRISCLPGTRLDVIKFFTEWIADESNDQKRVLWIYGLAGSGKSTISTTLAQTMRSLDHLGAFFYFNRDKPERDAAKLIRTLAQQLSLFDARIGTEVSRVVERFPNITAMSLDFQFAHLLAAEALKPIEWSGGPILVIIDALDECGSEKDRKNVVQVLSKGFSDLPPFIRVVVSSRQEPDIKGALGSHPAVSSYYLDINSPKTKDDITEFLQYRLAEIRTSSEYEYISFPPNWPGDEVIRTLRDRAAGLFVWASTACLYIESYDPIGRLEELLNQELVDTSSAPFASLDRLYKTGLQSAGSWDDRSFRSDCCDILGTTLCARTPISCSAMDSLLALPRRCLQSISHLRCVLQGNEAEVRILHPSFHDYLSRRSRGEVWFIDLEQHNEKLAIRCINLLDKSLRENIGGLSLAHPVRNETLPEAVSYACRFWIEHICLMSHPGLDITDRIHKFLSQHLLHWIEAQAILKSHGNTIQSLHNLLAWLKKLAPHDNDLYQLIYDAHRFAQYFANTIEQHPLLIYVSALPFAPADTRIYKYFYREGLPRVVCGVENSWQPQLLMLRGHEEYVHSVAFSPDGSKIISGCDDETIRVWDASTGVEILPPLRGHFDEVHSVAFSHDGSKIISGSRDKTIRVWNTNTGTETLPPLQGHDDDVCSVAYSHDGLKIVSGSRDKTIRVWDTSTGFETLPPLRGHEDHVRSVAFSYDGSKIVSGSEDKTVRIWDAITGVETFPPLRGHEQSVSSVAIARDGLKIVSGSADKTIRVWDANTGTVILLPLRGHDGWVASVAFSHDGSKIISGSWDKTIRVWDASTGTQTLLPFRGHDKWIYSIAPSHDGLKIVSGSADKTVRVWDASTGAEKLLPLQGHDKSVISVVLSHDGSKIASGSFDKTIRVWNTSTGLETLPPLRGHSEEVCSVAFSHDGMKVASGSGDRTIRVWDTCTGFETLPPLRGHDGTVRSVAFSRDGSKIVSASYDKTIRVWDVSTGFETLPPLRGHDDLVYSIAFSHDGLKIASGSGDKTIRVWSTSTGAEILPVLRGHDEWVTSVAFSHDGSKIVSGSEDKTIRVWNTNSGAEILPLLEGHDQLVRAVTFSPDGLKIISESDDKTIRIWDVSTGAIDTEISSTLHENTGCPECRLDSSFISLDIDGWFTDTVTGRCLGRLPVELSAYHWVSKGSYYIGWTTDHKILILHFSSAIA